VFPVRYELGFYISGDGILIVTALKTSNLTYEGVCIYQYAEGASSFISVSVPESDVFEIPKSM
jgi:hypothetical protein